MHGSFSVLLIPLATAPNLWDSKVLLFLDPSHAMETIVLIGGLWEGIDWLG
jgi:hypothetical protein